MDKTKKIYLMRHATSQHNSQKTLFKSQNNYHQPKSHPDYQTIKFSKSLIDSNVLNLQQIGMAKKQLSLQTIQIIFCSPLKRCLETCKQLIKGHQDKILVKVLPQLNSRLSAAWSIGSNIHILKQLYPKFDFSMFKGIQSTWMLSILSKQQDNRLIVQPFQKSSQQYLLELLKQDKGQSYHEFYVRINKLKIIILNLINQYNFMDSKSAGNVLIISHSCVLNFLLGKELNQKGKVKNKISFQHCVPKCFNLNQIQFKPIKMSKL